MDPPVNKHQQRSRLKRKVEVGCGYWYLDLCLVVVTGLVTVNGNSRPAKGENTERRQGSPYGSDGNYTTTLANKTLNTLQQPERNSRTVGYYEPTTMILNPLAFSPKLSARAVTGLGGSSKAFSNELFV